ncbi:transposase [Aeromonas sp. MR7]|uniref:transposase n=1 Tax=Aeromonas sp. MR7 TaxID=2923419 RepID=UPI001F4A763B|nr:transposase [Aeromonas sp. MR7]MCH7349509.1 transposase [Aeromonas sp. MR7]
MANWRRAWWPGGTWFFTVNLLERRNNRLLVEQIDLLRHSVAKVQQAHPFAIHAWVVLPDHLHCILSLPEGERGIWQRHYWEHLIRDEQDYRRHMDYVHINPLKHGHVTRVADWPYSTFHRYVTSGIYPQDWCGSVNGGIGVDLSMLFLSE